VPIVVLRVAAEISLGPESVGVVRGEENGEEVADEADETGDERQEGTGVVECHGSSMVGGVHACGERGRLVCGCARCGCCAWWKCGCVSKSRSAGKQ
jgi:hypothetical protein